MAACRISPAASFIALSQAASSMTGSSRKRKSTYRRRSRRAPRSGSAPAGPPRRTRLRRTAPAATARGDGPVPVSHGWQAAMNSSTGSARMYSPLNARSFFSSKNGGRGVDVLQPELVLDHRPRHDLPVAGGRPAEQHQVVAHRRRPGSPRRGTPPGRPCRGAWTASALLVDDHRHVRPDRRLRARAPPTAAAAWGCWAGAPRPRITWVIPCVDVVDDVGQQEQRRAVAARR